MATSRRTLRWHAQSDDQRLPQAVIPYADRSDLSYGCVGDNVYVRAAGDIACELQNCIPHAELLPAVVEVLEFTAHDDVAAHRLSAYLQGSGAPRSIAAVHSVEHRIVVELLSEPTLVLRAIDALMGTGVVRRRAVLPLVDSSLITAVAWLWNAANLNEQRILEVAAGDVSF